MMDNYKKAGEFIKEAPETIKACFKLALLEREWQRVAGLPALAEITAPAACEFTDDGIKITINVADPTKLMMVQSRRNILTQNIRHFLKMHNVMLEIKSGKVQKQSSAKPPLPDYMRQAPVLVSEAKLREETKKLMEEKNLDKEIAEALAKLRLTSERLASRGKN